MYDLSRLGRLEHARRRRAAGGGARPGWLRCLLAVFAVSLVALGALSVANDSFDQEPLADTLALLAFTAFMVVGALIVAHRPGNAIGWLFTASALLAVTGALAAEYAVYAFLTRPGWLPGAIVAAWYASWTWFLTVFLAFVFTMFSPPVGCCRPAGGPPPGSPWRWRRRLQYWPRSSPRWTSTARWSPT